MIYVYNVLYAPVWWQRPGFEFQRRPIFLRVHLKVVEFLLTSESSHARTVIRFELIHSLVRHTLSQRQRPASSTVNCHDTALHINPGSFC